MRTKKKNVIKSQSLMTITYLSIIPLIQSNELLSYFAFWPNSLKIHKISRCFPFWNARENHPNWLCPKNPKFSLCFLAFFRVRSSPLCHAILIGSKLCFVPCKNSLSVQSSLDVMGWISFLSSFLFFWKEKGGKPEVWPPMGVILLRHFAILLSLLGGTHN